MGLSVKFMRIKRHICAIICGHIRYKYLIWLKNRKKTAAQVNKYSTYAYV